MKFAPMYLTNHFKVKLNKLFSIKNTILSFASSKNNNKSMYVFTNIGKRKLYW